MPGRRGAGQRPGTTWAGALLVATLGLAVWLAYEAADSARSHRDTAEAAVRDYARVAAWQYARRSARALSDLTDELFKEVPRYGRAGLPSTRAVQSHLAAALKRVDCACPELARPPLLLLLDLRTLDVVGRPETLPATQLGPLADTLTAVAASGRSQGLIMFPEGALLPKEAALTYALVTDSLGPALAYLAAFDARSFGTLFRAWFQSAGLLPPAITGTLPNDSLVRVAIRSQQGITLYESAPPYPHQLVATDITREMHGRLVVEAAIRPDAVSRLIIGGMPRSRLWLILGLLLLTLGVGGAAVLQLQRDRQLTRLREDFISGVSHELRTPLAQIRMFAELQEAGKLRTDEDRARAISVINREAQRLTHLVENILRFSRLRYTSERSSVREAIGVGDMVAQVLEGFRSLTSARHMTVHADIEPGLAVLANRDALHQVLVNLLDNAVKYGPPGQCIQVAAGRSDHSTWIAVEDTGPGVPAEERERIWEPYLRLQRDVDARVPGTGIGLAVVAQLVATSGGRARVEDRPGGGARFVVELASPATAEFAADAAIREVAG